LQLDHLNHSLSSLEQNGRNDYIRPWFWVICLFLGPLIASICFQWYGYIGTRTLARTQGILTELIFEHSLRIRFKAESGEGGGSSGSSRAVTSAEASETGSIESETAGGSDWQSSTAPSESSPVKSKAKAGPARVPAENSAEAKKKDNFIGKINTLVTVDIGNMQNAKEILMLGKCCVSFDYVSGYIISAVLQMPLELSLAAAFLYIMLGWR